MRKRLLFILLSISVLGAAFAGGAYATNKLTLIINGELSKVDPLFQDGTTYLPLRAGAEMLGATVEWDSETWTATVKSKDIVTLVFPAERYPETAAHISAAIAAGRTAVCTIDRGGADANRELSLVGIPTKSGYDRDEWPMAMCTEGGAGADIAYVESSDNRGAGSWVGNALEQYADGTKIAFAVLGLDTSKVQTVKAAQPKPTTTPSSPNTNVIYNSCAEVKTAGKAPIRAGDPGYSTKLDRDGDGVACES